MPPVPGQTQIVDVHVQAAWGGDEARRRDDAGRGTDHHIQAAHGIGITGVADAGHVPIFDADIGLENAEHRVEDDRRY